MVSSELLKKPGLQVVSEASDGLEAIRKAEELKPDLIPLDIGLPKPQKPLDGSTSLSPTPKDAVQEALSFSVEGETESSNLPRYSSNRDLVYANETAEAEVKISQGK